MTINETTKNAIRDMLKTKGAALGRLLLRLPDDVTNEDALVELLIWSLFEPLTQPNRDYLEFRSYSSSGQYDTLDDGTYRKLTETIDTTNLAWQRKTDAKTFEILKNAITYIDPDRLDDLLGTLKAVRKR